MHKTQFAGLTELDPGDPITIDGGSFMQLNPSRTDYYLRIGAVTHKHDAHPQLQSPSNRPTATAYPLAGGQLGAGEGFYVGYTLSDATGGETRMGLPTLVTTPSGLVAPSAAISATFDPTGGALPVGQYIYALTMNDAAGGESQLGPAAFVWRQAGWASGRIKLSGLAQEVGESAGANQYISWNLWRAQDGEDFELVVAQGGGDTFTDDGTAPVDSSRKPPVDNTGIGINNVLDFTLPVALFEPAVANATSINIYISGDGTFADPCFFASYPVAQAGQRVIVYDVVVQEGEPPAVSLASQGANQINPDTDLLDWHWKRPVESPANLPAVGNASGDVRVSRNPAMAWEWTGSSWVPFPGNVTVTDTHGHQVPGAAAIQLAGASGTSVWVAPGAGSGAALVTIADGPDGVYASAQDGSRMFAQELDFIGSGGASVRIEQHNGSAVVIVTAGQTGATPGSDVDVGLSVGGSAGTGIVSPVVAEEFAGSGGISVAIQDLAGGSARILIGLNGGSGGVGPTGPPGPAGASGATGATGPTGPQGPAGSGGGAGSLYVAGSADTNPAPFLASADHQFAGSGSAAVAVQNLGGGSARILIGPDAGALHFRGAFAGGSYSINDVVTSGGQLYRCKTPIVAQTTLTGTANTQNNNAAANITIPAAAKVGDVALLGISQLGTNSDVTISGWTLVSSVVDSSNADAVRVSVHRRTLQTGDPGSTLSVPVTNNQWQAHMRTYTTAGIDSSATTTLNTPGTQSTGPFPPAAVAESSSKDAAVAFLGVFNTNGNMTGSLAAGGANTYVSNTAGFWTILGAEDWAGPVVGGGLSDTGQANSPSMAGVSVSLLPTGSVAFDPTQWDLLTTPPTVAAAGGAGAVTPDFYTEYVGSGGVGVAVQNLGGGSARVLIGPVAPAQVPIIAASGGASAVNPDYYTEFAGSGSAAVAVQNLGGGSARVLIGPDAGALHFRGAFAAGGSYGINDVVNSGGLLYRCKTPTTAQAPSLTGTSTTNNNNAAANITIPAAAKVGDVALLGIVQLGDNSDETISGWTLVSSVLDTSGTFKVRVSVYRRTLLAGEPGSTLSVPVTNNQWVAHMRTYTTAGIDSTATTAAWNGTTGPFSPAAVAEVSSKDFAVAVMGIFNTNGNMTGSLAAGGSNTFISSPAGFWPILAAEDWAGPVTGGALSESGQASAPSMAGVSISLLPTGNVAFDPTQWELLGAAPTVAAAGGANAVTPDFYTEYVGSGGVGVAVQNLGGGSARVLIGPATSQVPIVAASGGASAVNPDYYTEYAGSGGVGVAVQSMGGGSARILIGSPGGLPHATQASGYTFQPSDAGTVVESASAGTGSGAVGFIVQTRASVLLPLDSVIEVFQYGTGPVTIVPAAGVTLRSDGGKVKTGGQFATIGLRQRAADEWVLSGDLG